MSRAGPHRPPPQPVAEPAVGRRAAARRHAPAVANDPPLVVADEPPGNLDSHTAEDVFATLAGLVDHGKTVVYVPHAPDLANQATNRIDLLDGRIVGREWPIRGTQGPSVGGGRVGHRELPVIEIVGYRAGQHLDVSISPILLPMTLLIVLGVAILSSVVPAVSASRLPVDQALRYE